MLRVRQQSPPSYLITIETLKLNQSKPFKLRVFHLLTSEEDGCHLAFWFQVSY